MHALLKDEAEAPTDPLGSPTLFARERIRAAKRLLLNKCRPDEVSRQLDYAVEALDLADASAARPRPIRAWGVS